MVQIAPEPPTINDLAEWFTKKYGPPGRQIDEACYRSAELEEMWGLSKDQVLAELRELKSLGLLVETQKKIEPLGRPGVYVPVAAYQIREREHE